MNDLALGVDLGSHGARAVVLDGDVVVATTTADYGPPRPPARRPALAWWAAFADAIVRIDTKTRAAIRTLAITGVRGAVVGVDAQGEAATVGYPDFDPDAVAPARALLERFGDEYMARTACFAFPLAGLPKMLLHAGDARVHAWLGPQDFVRARLTGLRTLSTASAFRFGILRTDGRSIDRDLLEAVGLDPKTIPPLAAVGSVAGEVGGHAARELGMPIGIPAVAAPGDVPAALYAVSGERDDRAFVNLGTTIVATVAVPTVVDGMSCDVLPGGRRALETGRGAGAVTLEWCATLIGTTPDALEARVRGARAAATPRLEPDLVDAWGAGSGGALHGIVSDTGPAELAAATLAAVAQAASEAVDELTAGAGSLAEIVLGGGASQCAPIVDRLRRSRSETVTVAAGRELAAEGAARIARGVRAGRVTGPDRVS